METSVPSLCNLHNPGFERGGGETPMLACLRQCAELLCRRDVDRTKADEMMILKLFETFRKLLEHPYTDLFRCNLTHAADGSVLR